MLVLSRSMVQMVGQKYPVLKKKSSFLTTTQSRSHEESEFDHDGTVFTAFHNIILELLNETDFLKDNSTQEKAYGFFFSQ